MVYRFGSFTLDTKVLELQRGDELVPLRRQAYDTLVHLVRARDRVVSKQEILDKIWEGRIVTENALSQCITDIRRALGDEARTLLQTVRATGFRFVGAVEEAIPAFPERWSDPSASTEVPGVPSTVSPDAVAVLPFGSVDGDARGQRFGLGVSEDLVRCLSGWRRFPVISASSTWRYGSDGDQRWDAKALGRELGASYLVDGRVQVEGDRVRVRVHLSDAASGEEIWSDRFDERLVDFFAIQDEVADMITARIHPELFRAQMAKAKRHRPESLDAWDLTVLGLAHHHRGTAEDLERASELFERAAVADPGFVLPEFYAGYVEHLRVYYQWNRDIDRGFDRVRVAAERCLKIDRSDPLGHMLQGLVAMVESSPVRALSSMEDALERNPSLAEAQALLGQVLAMRGRPEESVRHARLALRLSPQDPQRGGFLAALAMGHFVAGRYEESARCAEEACRERLEVLPGYLCIASCSGLLGDDERAAWARAAIEKLAPNFSVAPLERLLSSTLPEIRERFWDGLARAHVHVPRRS